MAFSFVYSELKQSHQPIFDILYKPLSETQDKQ